MSLFGNGNGNNGHEQNGHRKNGHEKIVSIGSHTAPEIPASELTSTSLLPEGFSVPTSRNVHPSKRMRHLLETEPYLFGPGVYDPMTAQLVMYYGFKAVYFSGYSFAMGHVGSTDMDLYSNTEIADAARRTVSALRKFQLTQAVGDPEKGTSPKHLHIPPVIVDMDGGYGNIFNVQRTAELYVQAGVAAAHLEDQVLPKRCGHIGGKALIPANEMIGKLRMARAVANDLGNPDFVLIARTDGISAVDAPESARGIELAIDRGLRYLDTGIPDMLWCEFPTSDRGPVEKFSTEIQKRFPKAKFAFNYSSSFKWFNDDQPLSFSELGEMGVRFIFITLGAQHATAHGLSVLLQAMSLGQEMGYIELQQKEFEPGQDFPSKSHHFFSGVPYHHLVGKMFDAARLGKEFVEELPEEKVV
ncbi:MAG TPA: isocitrate lyase/PEP mutase family protein [Terriglobales bacterium]|nr:isocitrate lyase/PEP mutase family protein [Terriglobales bacterium]